MRPWYMAENKPIIGKGIRRYKFTEEKNRARVWPTFGIPEGCVYQINRAWPIFGTTNLGCPQLCSFGKLGTTDLNSLRVKRSSAL